MWLYSIDSAEGLMQPNRIFDSWDKHSMEFMMKLMASTLLCCTDITEQR